MQDSRTQPGGGNPETDNANSPGFQWSANNTVSQDNAPVSDPDRSGAAATDSGGALDEDQVVLLTGHWSMEQ